MLKFQHIKRLGVGVFMMSHTSEYKMEDTISIAILPGGVSLAGCVGTQFFKIEGSYPGGILEKLIKEITRKDLIEAATVYTEGTVNKGKAYSRLNDIKGRLGDVRYAAAVDVIKNCDCGPEALRNKLLKVSMSHTQIDALDFREDRPELLDTVDAMERFILHPLKFSKET